jgi:phage baseplate assembly protein W
MSLYRGFSTVNELSQKKFRLTNYELIKQDLLNSLNTRLGSRLMNPREGCIAWELLYEPFTPEIKNALVENLNTIISNDPRVRLDSLNLLSQEDQNSITVEINIIYTSTNQLDTMIVRFDQRQ